MSLEISEELKSLIKGLLELECEKRISLEDTQNHIWLTEIAQI